MAVYQVPLQEAIRVTGATCSAVGLYQRLGRLRKRNARLEEDIARVFDLQRQQVSVFAQEVETEHASVRVQEADVHGHRSVASTFEGCVCAVVRGEAIARANS